MFVCIWHECLTIVMIYQNSEQKKTCLFQQNFISNLLNLLVYYLTLLLLLFVQNDKQIHAYVCIFVCFSYTDLQNWLT